MSASERAPEFPDDADWLGVDSTVAFTDQLRGRVRLVYFWNATSIHCLQCLPDLAWLELRFADRPFVIVGVHTPKFDAFRDRRAVERAIDRHAIRHAVLHDPERRVWREWGARAWPTFVLVDASGEVRYRGGGEPDRQRLATAIEALCGEAGRGSAADLALSWPPVRTIRSRTELRWPGGLAVDADASLLWIADTGRHRLVAADLESGELRHVVGCGQPGAADGDPGYAGFCAPRGLAIGGGRVWVADAGNHLVRWVDVEECAVATLLGQGRRVADRAGGCYGVDQGIASPWDLVVRDDELFVAIAGVNQVWTASVHDGYSTVLAGTGCEDWTDGLAHDCALAQPAGLALREDRLAIVDAATSSVRLLDLNAYTVETLVGGGDAFEFGDVDGPFAQARLQHAAGIDWWGEDLVVADPLNDAIKLLWMAERRVETVAGLASGLCAPEAVAVYGEMVFVADTANHRIVRVDLSDGSVEPFELVDSHPDHPEPDGPAVVVQSNSSVRFCFPLACPLGERDDPDAPPRAFVRNREGDVLERSFAGPVDSEGEWGVLRGVPTGDPDEGAIELVVRQVTCADLDGAGHARELGARFRVRTEPSGPEVTDLPLDA